MYYGSQISQDDGYAIFVSTGNLQYFKEHENCAFYGFDCARCLQDIDNALSEMCIQATDLEFGSRLLGDSTVEVIISYQDNKAVPDGYSGPFEKFSTALGYNYINIHPKLAVQLLRMD